MIAVDTNVLVYAHRADSPFHESAAATVRLLAEGHRSWAIPWPCVHEFYSVVTHSRIYDPPSSARQALDQLAAWSESPRLQFIGERADHLHRLTDLALDSATVGPRIYDARIAAICLTHGVDYLVTLDRDFSRFPKLQTKSPLR